MTPTRNAPNQALQRTAPRVTASAILDNKELLIKNFLGGRLEISLDRNLFVLAFHVLRQ